MDNLARNAMLARQAGMSYGKWKALQPTVPIESTIPDGWMTCEYCGKPFAPKKGKRFCDLECRNKSAEIRKKENDHGQA